MRKLLAALAALCFALPAFAATYYVRSDGSDSNDGTTLAKAWATIGHANASVQPGDAVLVSAGTYADAPSPAASPSGGSGFYFYGDTATPYNTIITADTVTGSYLNVRGFHFNNGLVLKNTASRDTIANCWIDGGQMFSLMGCSYVVVRANTIHTNYCMLDGYIPATRQASFNASGLTFIGNTVDQLGRNSPATFFPQPSYFQVGEGYDPNFGKQFPCRVDTVLIQNNSVTMHKANAATGQPSALNSFENMKHATLTGNTWTLEVEAPQGASAWVFRDSCSNVVVHRDSSYSPRWSGRVQPIFTQNQYRHFYQLTPHHPTTTDVQIDSSAFYMTNGLGPMWIEGMKRWKLLYNTFLSDMSSYSIEGPVVGPNRIDHNLFATGTETNYTAVFDNFVGQGWVDTTRAINNVFYWMGPAPANDCNNCAQTSYQAGVRWTPADFDSALEAGGTSANHLISDWNLYAYYGSDTSMADRSLIYWVNGYGDQNSKPGTSTEWYLRYGQDAHSIYGSPQYGVGGPDSVISSFVATPGANSKVIAADSAGNDIGPRGHLAPAQLSLNPFKILAPDVQYPNSYTTPLIVSNVGGTAMHVHITYPSYIPVTVSATDFTLNANTSRTLTVTYQPPMVGSYCLFDYSFQISTDAPFNCCVAYHVTIFCGGSNDGDPGNKLPGGGH